MAPATQSCRTGSSPPPRCGERRARPATGEQPAEVRATKSALGHVVVVVGGGGGGGREGGERSGGCEQEGGGGGACCCCCERLRIEGDTETEEAERGGARDDASPRSRCACGGSPGEGWTAGMAGSG
nr:unnamed protein product [Digitaria exilis]CAB3448859.1 unnamed protein product [Digitaria exilis]